VVPIDKAGQSISDRSAPRDYIAVVDFGSQYTPLIARRIREAEVYSEIFSYLEPTSSIIQNDPRGIILSGSDASVYGDSPPHLPESLLELEIPILGICYGMQIITDALGGAVAPSKTREYGPATMEIADLSHPIFAGFPETTRVWMSHGDRVVLPPPGFEQLARTEGSEWAAVANENDIVLVQFHPEVKHTQLGHAMLRNFVLNMCDCKPSWTPTSFIEQTVREIDSIVGNGVAIAGISGGVDSTVASALVHRAIGNKLQGIFVDTGLLRANEVSNVEESLSKHLEVPLLVHDASDRFLNHLNGVTDPETKRKIVGEEFINVFVQEAAKIDRAEFFVQGTIYPDTIESGSAGLNSAKIKTHHNTHIPDTLNLQVVEPLRRLFKDEVRQVGLELGLPDELVWRQPFPGPGLAVRIIGQLSRDRIRSLQIADAIFDEEIRSEGLDRVINQYFVVLTNIKTVGVMGDARTYGEVAALRAVITEDFMTADWHRLPYEVLARTSSRIVNEVPQITRVVYDITPKPPGTIEWE
tara:strand:- start:404 stop:1984 length:1581 start_codon:yes stop_codon:yes gene_type:complete